MNLRVPTLVSAAEVGQAVKQSVVKRLLKPMEFRSSHVDVKSRRWLDMR